MTKPLNPLLILLLLLSACGISSCTGDRQQETLDRAESLIEDHPDSALNILEGIDKSGLGSKKKRARYALLMSMALDKNYIDTTTFDVLQPAIDYYLKKGNPDEKLRTYYYQGRIYQNQGNLDNALSSFTKGIDIAPEGKDSLCLARALVAQGGLYYQFYDFESYTGSNLRAAGIYKRLSRKTPEFDCLLNALNGAKLLDDKSLGDSLLKALDGINDLDSARIHTLSGYRLSYIVQFEDNQKIKDLIKSHEEDLNLDANGMLNLAFAYHKTGNDIKAMQLLDNIRTDIKEAEYDTLKYQSILVPVLESLGNYKDALIAYKGFTSAMDSIDTRKFDEKAQTIEEKHNLELKAQQDAREKDRIIWGCIGGIIILVLGIFILILSVRSNRAQKCLAEQRARTSELENENLRNERERLSLENKTLQLEKDKKALEAENLSQRVAILENESESLKSLMESQEELPPEVKKTIESRMEMLNSLFVNYITDQEEKRKSYEAQIKELTENTEEFMNSNRLAFQASYPRFIQYFEEHGLTVSEINYVCLYAIGLNGKEVGSYIKKPGHVNLSSAIRKKLGMDKHETNIGIYVRKLLKTL